MSWIFQPSCAAARFKALEPQKDGRPGADTTKDYGSSYDLSGIDRESGRVCNRSTLTSSVTGTGTLKPETQAGPASRTAKGVLSEANTRE